MQLFSLFNLIINKFIPLTMGLLGIGLVMAVHEFGHFLFGKLFNVHIPNFSIGMGPKIASKKIGETTFSLSLIPVGAYVEANDDPKTAGGKHRTISQKTYLQKMAIVSGGILGNIIFAYLIFIGLSLTGVPANPLLMQKSPYSIENVLPHSLAEKSGLKKGDRILTFNTINVSNDIKKLLQLLKKSESKNIITIERNNQIHTIELTAQGKNPQKGIVLGVEFKFPSLSPVSLPQSCIQAGKLVVQILKNTFHGFLQAFSQKSASGFAGPLMMISLTSQSAQNGFSSFFLLLAFISVGLAFLNAIPLAVLDGGHAFIYTLEALLGKHVPESFEAAFQYFSLGVLGMLFVYLTLKDIFMLFITPILKIIGY